MLRINKSRENWWPARIFEPQDGGTTTPYDLEIRVRLPRADEAAQTDREFIERHVVDWRGVNGEPLPFCDDADKPLEFSKENLSAVLALAYVSIGLVRAINECARGIAAKN